MEALDDLARLVGLEAAELQNAADAFDEAAARVLGLNSNDLHCLGLITLRGPMTAGELAEAAGLTPGAITSLVDRLERAGFAQRRHDSIDRRRVLIEPSEYARATADRIWGPLAEQGHALLLGYSAAELATILRFLREARALQERHALRVRSLGSKPPAAASRV